MRTKKTIFIIFIIFFVIKFDFLVLGDENNKTSLIDLKNLAVEKEAIVKTVQKLYYSWKVGKYYQVLELTTNKEKKIYEKMLKAIKQNKGRLPGNVVNYLNRISGIEIGVDDVTIVPDLGRAFAECRYVFKGKSISGHTKKRIVSYVLLKTKKGWKIEYSRPLQEVYEAVK